MARSPPAKRWIVEPANAACNGSSSSPASRRRMRMSKASMGSSAMNAGTSTGSGGWSKPVIVEDWRRDDNECRPHSSLGNRMPREFALAGLSPRRQLTARQFFMPFLQKERSVIPAERVAVAASSASTDAAPSRTRCAEPDGLASLPSATAPVPALANPNSPPTHKSA